MKIIVERVTVMTDESLTGLWHFFTYMDSYENCAQCDAVYICLSVCPDTKVALSAAIVLLYPVFMYASCIRVRVFWKPGGVKSGIVLEGRRETEREWERYVYVCMYV